MADDDDKQKKHTLESLFHLYANNIVVPLDLDNEDYDCILLSQIDYWLDQAKLLKTVFSQTETGLAYMRFRCVSNEKLKICIEMWLNLYSFNFVENGVWILRNFKNF